MKNEKINQKFEVERLKKLLGKEIIKRNTTAVRISRHLLRGIRISAKRRKMTMARLIDEIVELHLISQFNDKRIAKKLKNDTNDTNDTHF